MNRLLSAREFATLTGFAPKTISDYCRRGLIPGARRATGGAPWRIPESSINRIGEHPNDQALPPRTARAAARRKSAA